MLARIAFTSWHFADAKSQPPTDIRVSGIEGPALEETRDNAERVFPAAISYLARLPASFGEISTEIGLALLFDKLQPSALNDSSAQASPLQKA